MSTPAAAISRTREVTKEATAALMKNPAVANVVTFSGFDLLSRALKSNSGISFVTLKDWSQRTDPKEDARNVAPALAAGCTVVVKSPPQTPWVSATLGAILAETDIPAGVVNVVAGYGETAGAALASHPGVDKVAFTGSHVTGQSIVRASAGNLKRVSLELGGKSPDTVFADADLDAAVPGAAMAVFANSGQICSAGTRLFVEHQVYDEFVGRVAEFGKKLQVGNGLVKLGLRA